MRCNGYNVPSLLQSFIPAREPNKSATPTDTASIESSTAQEDAIIDFDAAASVLGTSKAKIREMIGMYYDSIPEELSPIEAAYEQKDWATVQALTHKMKGATSYIGLTRLHKACKQIEQSIKAEQTENYEMLYLQFLAEVASFRETYDALPPLLDDI